MVKRKKMQSVHDLIVLNNELYDSIYHKMGPIVRTKCFHDILVRVERNIYHTVVSPLMNKLYDDFVD